MNEIFNPTKIRVVKRFYALDVSKFQKYSYTKAVSALYITEYHSAFS